MALSEVSRLLQSYGIDGVFKNGAMLKTLHRQVQEDFGEEASTDIEIKSQKEDRVAAAYLKTGKKGENRRANNTPQASSRLILLKFLKFLSDTLITL